MKHMTIMAEVDAERGLIGYGRQRIPLKGIK
jgi:hypothetical protein